MCDDGFLASQEDSPSGDTDLTDTTVLDLQAPGIDG